VSCLCGARQQMANLMKVLSRIEQNKVRPQIICFVQLLPYDIPGCIARNSKNKRCKVRRALKVDFEREIGRLGLEVTPSSGRKGDKYENAGSAGAAS
jgi:hypothetical protein